MRAMSSQAASLPPMRSFQPIGAGAAGILASRLFAVAPRAVRRRSQAGGKSRCPPRSRGKRGEGDRPKGARKGLHFGKQPYGVLELVPPKAAWKGTPTGRPSTLGAGFPCLTHTHTCPAAFRRMFDVAKQYVTCGCCLQTKPSRVSRRKRVESLWNIPYTYASQMDFWGLAFPLFTFKPIQVTLLPFSCISQKGSTLLIWICHQNPARG